MSLMEKLTSPRPSFSSATTPTRRFATATQWALVASTLGLIANAVQKPWPVAESMKMPRLL